MKEPRIFFSTSYVQRRGANVVIYAKDKEEAEQVIAEDFPGHVVGPEVDPLHNNYSDRRLWIYALTEDLVDEGWKVWHNGGEFDEEDDDELVHPSIQSEEAA